MKSPLKRPFPPMYITMSYRMCSIQDSFDFQMLDEKNLESWIVSKEKQVGEKAHTGKLAPIMKVD